MKKNIIYPLIVGIILVVLTPAILKLSEGVALLSALAFPFISIWDTLTGTLTIRFYWLVLLPILTLLGVAILAYLTAPKGKVLTPADELLRKVQTYGKDKFEGVIYRWRYYKAPNGKVDILEHQMFCPNDDCELVGGEYGGPPMCPICKQHFQTLDQASLYARIRHTIRKEFHLD